MHTEDTGLSVAFAFSAVLAKQKSTSTLNLVHALASLSKCTLYECKKRGTSLYLVTAENLMPQLTLLWHALVVGAAVHSWLLAEA